MLVFFSIIIFKNVVKSPWLVDRVPQRIDYYESLSNPVMCIQLLHQYPTTPDYIYSTFSYKCYSLSGNLKQHKFVKFIIKKVNHRCETSVIFTTLGIDFKELEINIEMYLSRKIGYIAEFNYKFYQGFEPKVYALTDINNNFRMNVKVTNESQDYLGIPENVEDEFESYSKSINTKKEKLCIITSNSNAVVLNPIYESFVPSWFIFGFMAVIFRDGMYVGERNYTAYACHKNIRYPKIPIVFATDGEKFRIKFKVLYWYYFTDSKELAIEFKLAKPIFIDVHNLNVAPPKSNIVFLIKLYGDYKYCKDGYFVFEHLSEDGTKYYAHSEKRIELLPAVEFIRRVDHSINDPCGELKKVKYEEI